MNYPKIGYTYKLTQDISFVACGKREDGCLSYILRKGEVVHFLTCAIHGANACSIGPQDVLICYLSNDKHGKFVVTYKVLIELVQSGALVSFIEGDIHNKLSLKVEQLGLSARARNVVLQMHDVVTVRDLVSKTESDLLKLKQCGPKTLAQIKMKLSELGLYFMPNR